MKKNLLFLCFFLLSTINLIPKPLIIGHRGACGYAPENTLISFQKALDLGVDGIEFDVQLSKDGHVIVMHDKTIDRTTNGLGYVKNKTLEELKILDAGQGQIIPTLQETLDLIDQKAIAFIELKSKETALPVADIIQDYVQNKGWAYDNFMITTFDHQELKIFMSALPQVKTCAAYFCVPLGLAEQAEKQGVYALTLMDEFMDKDFFDDTHKRNIKIFLAIFDYSEKNLEFLKQYDFDGFYVNFPDNM